MKTNHSDSHSASASVTLAADPTPATPTLGVTDPVPTGDAPSPPAGFVAPSKLGRSKRPQYSQIQLAVRAASELRGSTTYGPQLGQVAPDRTVVADALTTARAWTDKLRGATAWMKYVQQQEHLAWKRAMSLVEDLKVPFALRAARDPSIASDYPSLTAFLAVDHERSVRAAATRRKKRAKKSGPTAPAPVKETPPVSVPDPVKTAAVRLINASA